MREGPVIQDHDGPGWDIMRHAGQVVKDIKLPAMPLGAVLMPDDSADLKLWQKDHKMSELSAKDLGEGGLGWLALAADSE